MVSVASLAGCSGSTEDDEVVAVIGCDSGSVGLEDTSFRGCRVGGEVDAARAGLETVAGVALSGAKAAAGTARSAVADEPCVLALSSSAMAPTVLVDARYEDKWPLARKQTRLRSYETCERRLWERESRTGCVSSYVLSMAAQSRAH